MPSARLRPAALAIALTLTAAAAAAQSPPPPSRAAGGVFRMDIPAGLPTGPQVARRGAPLAVFELRSPAAVRLETGVDAKADNWLGASLRRPLAAGQVLAAAPAFTGGLRTGVYCAPVKEGAWYSVSPCLLDRDGDGRFEAALTAAFNSGETHGLLVTDKRNLLGVLYSQPKPLAAPVAYTTTDYRAGPSAKVRLTWTARRDSRKPDGPVELTFQLDASDSDSGTRALTPIVRLSLPGGVGETNVEGVGIRTFGFDAGGALRYELDLPTESRTVAMGWVGSRTVIIGY
ncbi:MAG TPA: hypothetical protein VEA44_02985 [Caulobacter sp.]|nr:hypothetical protein [Caulobacter sp.]